MFWFWGLGFFLNQIFSFVFKGRAGRIHVRKNLCEKCRTLLTGCSHECPLT